MSLFYSAQPHPPFFPFFWGFGGVGVLFGPQVFARVDAAGALGLDALLLSEEFGGSERKRSFISSIFPWRAVMWDHSNDSSNDELWRLPDWTLGRRRFIQLFYASPDVTRSSLQRRLS